MRAALRAGGNAVVVAPPGAGKSTVVPLALLEEPWARGKRIVMLEPRRLATRAVAERMAATLGERVGDTVGYRMRLETRVGKRTRIEVVTEGVFTRMLQNDPALDGVAAVLFDEYHERSLHADVGLAFALDAQRHSRPSCACSRCRRRSTARASRACSAARPSSKAWAACFPSTCATSARACPRCRAARSRSTRAVARAVQRALADSTGDLLVFLPGAGEIRRVERRLRDESRVGADVDVLPLYGELAPGEQDAALAPARAGRRKVVLATNIAETSLTIDGVRVVVDAGLERRSLFDPVTGMSRLETQRIARASAEQRAGRAGRTAPGVCYRLWSESADRSLAAYAAPEIAVADLVPLALDLAAWGTPAEELRWLDAPPAATLAGARDLLARLGALDASGRITPHGRAMQSLAAHPRLAHMLLKGSRARRDGGGGEARGALVRARSAARRRARQRHPHALGGDAARRRRARRARARAPRGARVPARARRRRRRAQ